MESKTILFHSNEEKKCEEFVSGKIPLILSKNSQDDKWLGVGMYFWDNKGNANWWNKKQLQKNPSIKYKIIKVNADTSHLLDLTDYDVCTKMEELWNSYCKEIDKDPDVPLGNKLNALFDAFPEFGKVYMVIKLYGKYNGTPSRGFITFDYKSRKAEPTMAAKCIYSVKNDACILEREIIEEGNYE